MAVATRNGDWASHLGLRAGRWQGITVLALAVALLVALPLLFVARSVFSASGEIWSHLAATVLPTYLINSFWLVLGVGLGTLAIGVPAAWFVTMCRFPGRAILEIALLLPLAMPAYAIAFAYAGLLDFAGPVQSALRESFGWRRGDYWFPEIRSLPGAVWVMTAVLYPYVYMLARAAFLEQSVCALEVSRLMGRDPWRGFIEVAVPLARPALVAGVTLALMETLADFGAVQYLAVDTFTTGIFRTWFSLQDHAAASGLAALLMALVFLLIAAERFSRGEQRYHHTSGRYRPLPGYHLTGWRRALAILACTLPFLFGFAIPVGQLGLWAIQAAAHVDRAFLGQAAASIGLAAVAAVIAVLVAVLLAYAKRLSPTPLVAGAVRVAGLGYAVPGSVIAVGVLVPFAAADTALNSWSRSLLGMGPGLILSGTLFAVLYAYLVRFLAVSLGTVEAGLAKVTPSMDRAARSLGSTTGSTLRRVHAPMMAGSLLTAALLVFVDVMKELPATMILRPFDFTTLALETFERAADERLAEASLPALAIVVVGLIPVIVMSRAISAARPGTGGAP
ncbi:MAG: iron ABC transporter permease [Alphaproteobacteria bacterium]|nr:iron ABC transporter permease [Alphaproteobacteria bacterium]